MAVMSARGLLVPAQLLLLDDERDDPHARQLVALTDGGIALAGGDHHLVLAVHGQQTLRVHPEQPITGGLQLDLALLDLTALHVLRAAQRQQALRRVVLMHHAGGHLIDVQVLLAHAQQHGDVLLRDHMALAEPCVLVRVFDDLGHVVAQHMAHSVLCADELHVDPSRRPAALRSDLAHCTVSRPASQTRCAVLSENKPALSDIFDKAARPAL